MLYKRKNMLTSLENNAKHENKLRNIIALNKVGSTIYTDTTTVS